MFAENETDTAYALATQLVGSAFIARRDMVDVEASVLAHSVLADAALALHRMAEKEPDPEAKAHLLLVASIIDALRADLPVRRSGSDVSAA